MKRIALVGGGPSALFMYKRLIEENINALIVIYERTGYLGAGMPYSEQGASEEHITNVSPNEIPELETSVAEWLETAPPEIIRKFNVNPNNLNEYKVLPRLLFGHYLHGQFELLLKKGKEKGIQTKVWLNSEIIDINDDATTGKATVISNNGKEESFDHVIICSGHRWPTMHEEQLPGYYDSPYPPSKLSRKINKPVAIRGSSLTAIDAIRTLARHNGSFAEKDDGMLIYTKSLEAGDFSITMYSLNGLLPALRFHLEDPLLHKNTLLDDEVITGIREQNDGFLPLDYVFDKNFKELFRNVDPDLYKTVTKLSMEEFVAHAMSLRTELDAVTLFKAEFKEAEKSIRRRESVHWKEMLAVLSFAMNYPAKHFSAEDMLRLQKVLKPLISIVIAFIPQSSAKEMLALFDAGVLDIVAVDERSKVIPGEKEGAVVTYFVGDREISTAYPFFLDCIGQPQIPFNQFPYKSLLDKKTISPALIRFRSKSEGEAMRQQEHDAVEKTMAGEYYLKVSGIAINDNFQVLDALGIANPRIFIMAVPYIGGMNPDYSGLDFCETASAKIVSRLLEMKTNFIDGNA